MSESVSFMSKQARLQIQFKPERKGFNRFGQVDTIPWEPIVFKDGRFKTEDPEKIKFLRNCPAFRQNRIIEVTEEDKQNVSMHPPSQKTTRGPVSSKDLKDEGKFEEEKTPGVTMQEMGTIYCDVPGCKYFSERDFRGNKIRMHKLAKHGIGKKAKKAD